MNISVIFIIGLPGSGKTTLLSDITDGYIIDDFSKNTSLLNEYLRNPTGKLYIADPTLCLTTKEKAENFLTSQIGSIGEISFEWWHFENEPDKAWRNVEKRNDGRIIAKSFLNYMSRSYNSNHDLENVKTIEIFQ